MWKNSSRIDGRGNTSKYEYTNASNVERKQGKDPVRVITNSGYEYEYDLHGNIIKEILLYLNMICLEI